LDSYNEIIIENKIIGKNQPCYIIAEIGVNHNGSLSLAKKLIVAAIDSGADAVKFQKRNLESLYRKDALDNPNSESQGFEILLGELKEIELSENDYFEIVDYCKEKKKYVSLHSLGSYKCRFFRRAKDSCIQNCLW